MPDITDEKDSSSRGAENGEFSLDRLLFAADLQRYESKLRNELKLRHAGDIQYVEEQDLSGIGMSRPEQKRLRKEYEKLYPSGLVGKLKKVFGRGENGEKRDAQSNPNREDEEDQHVIPLEKISLCKELGQGEFGAVWQASWKGGPNGAEVMQVAVKCVAPDKLVASSSSFLQEAAIMTRMRHENVVRLYGVVLDTKRVMMVSELATCGSLLECLHKPALRDSFPVHVLCDYAEQIAKGMAYLESQRLIHRDLAARNVLVFSPKKVKISDFGLSRSLGVGEDYYRSEFNPNLKLPIAWCAPECINFLKFTSASDVWAYGVTLWELFTYGEMPWREMNGAQILNAVDRERRHLSRPSHCPEDIYETMRECWTHTPQERPTFAQLVAQFPERLPQTVRAICEVNDGIEDHLQFHNNDLITVIDKTPNAYPDGFFWFGSLRNGRTGLFRPADTVAHLGAEQPASGKVLTTGCVASPVEKKEEKKSAKKSKEEQHAKRKALISEPVGDVRHTCHVGIDGTAFGLLQLDKKELVPPSVSPSLSNVSASPPVQMRSDVAREGVTLRETRSLRDVAPLNTSLTSPPISRAPSQPPLPTKSSRASAQPSAPPLTASAANSMNRDMQQVFDELNSSLRSLETTSSSTTPLILEELNRRPKPVSAVYARTPTREQVSPASTSDSCLEAELRHLERDLTDFSISTLNDFSDTRPLISASPTFSHRGTNGTTTTSTSTSTKTAISGVRPMTEDELQKWNEKQQREHKKAEMKLLEEKRKETTVRSTTHVQETTSTEKSFVDSYQKGKSQPAEWSPEAQEAYKLLVECGTNLKQTPSPVMSPVSTLDRREHRITVIENKPSPPPRPPTPPRQEEAENVASYSPQKRIHYIETKLLDGPARGLSPTTDRVAAPGLPPKGSLDQRQPPGLPPKMRQVPVTLNGRMNYDNLNGVGAGKAPPPVPPKPKVTFGTTSVSPPPPATSVASPTTERESPGCAPAIARSTLFTANKKEEVVKF